MTDPHPIKNIYWNGGGFTGMVHSIAVFEEMEREKSNPLTKINFPELRQFGVSGGTGIALLIVLGFSADDMMNLFFKQARMHDRGNVSFQESLSKVVMTLLEFALRNETDTSIREKCNGRLVIGYVKNGELHYQREFNTRAEITRAILYSSNIPGAITHETEFGEGICMDGGMVSVDPTTMTRNGMTEENTMVVTSHMPVPWCLMEWSKETYMMLYAYNSGMIRVNGLVSSGFEYDATDNWVRKHGLVPVMTMIHRMTVRTPAWNEWLDKKLLENKNRSV